MTAVLLVRMSSLGDIVHTFPAVTGLKRHRPDLTLDWLVKDQYADLARMHPGVDRVLPRSGGRALLRETRYEAVIDAQGLIKSALIASQARGPLHGFAWDTAREPLASWFYRHKMSFAPAEHKIVRYRALVARALGFVPDTEIDYGLTAPAAPAWLPRAQVGRTGAHADMAGTTETVAIEDGGVAPYAVLLHSTARAAKLWAEASWIATAQALEARGLVCVLPFGNPDEAARARRIAQALLRPLVAPRMGIVEAAGLAAHARMVIGLDTGLTHLAAAFSTPVVGVFCDSEPVDARPAGQGPTAYCGGIGTPPSVAEVLAALDRVAPGLLAPAAARS